MDRIILTQPPSSRPSTVIPSEDSAAGLETQSTSPSAPSTNVALKRKKRRKLKSALDLTTFSPNVKETVSVDKSVPASDALDALRRGRTVDVPQWGLLAPSFKSHLDLFRTDGCRSLELHTSRLVLRQSRPEDLAGVQRIKMEPIVQKTQLYGSPSAADCRESFLNRYIRSSMPRIGVNYAGLCRDEFVFAITLAHPDTIELKPAGAIRMGSILSSAEGYVGNIALALEPINASTRLSPKARQVYTHPTFQRCSDAKLTGNLFYELHPQLWGRGLMTEAFEEVLRFAMEEVGCEVVISNPTTTNPASIKLCTRFGMKHSHTNRNNEYQKPQAFYTITRKAWWARYRPDKGVKGLYEGKQVCRWCMNFRLDEPTILCAGCDWAKYCSTECRYADWMRKGGHQNECTRP